MEEIEKRRTGLLHTTDELRKLIIEYPDLPLLVFAGEDSPSLISYYTACSKCCARKGEFLDCCQDINSEYCYTDRDEFKEDMENSYAAFEGTDDEFERFIESELAKYEPYWKDCIILFVDN